MFASMHTYYDLGSGDACSIDNGTTNSFVHCASLLHAAGLLHRDCAMGWCRAVPTGPLGLYDVSHLAQAPSELLDILGTLPNAKRSQDFCRKFFPGLQFASGHGRARICAA